MTSETTPALNKIRWDHTGALHRPQWLRELGYQFTEGKVTAEELRAGQDKAVSEMLGKEEAAGLPVLTDGEYRRHSYHESFGGAVAGYDKVLPYAFNRPQGRPAAPGRLPTAMPGPGPAILHRLPVKERLHLVRNVILEEYTAASALTEKPVKVSLIGPDRIWHRFEWESSLDVYPSPDEFLADIVAIERQIIAEVVEAGCRYVQFDEPSYIDHVDATFLQAMRARGEDSQQMLDKAIAATNAIVADFPEVTFGLHICRGGGGGRGGRIHREGSYDAIAEQLFSELDIDRFLLEYDSDLAGGFEPLRFVPKEKVVMLGLVCNNTPDVENADYLLRRLEEASKYLPLEQAAIGPRCGMSSLDEDIMWAKLGVIREVAEKVWS
ncbi:MAG TPA: cobalamin-independent methionine synthase II family protein [Dehalococcoidia bacterium]|nr:cobalamin-independent methionine synthase II family protein [Dehalococcoidia bacterium]